MYVPRAAGRVLCHRYPQVKTLYGVHWLNKYVMGSTVLVQVRAVAFLALRAAAARRTAVSAHAWRVCACVHFVCSGVLCSARVAVRV